MNYQEEDIEFANRLLNHRNSLQDDEVCKWLKDQSHVRLLEDIALLRQQLQPLQSNDLQKREALSRLKREIKKHQAQKRLIRWSAAASILLCIGIILVVKYSQPKISVPALLAQEQTLFPVQQRAQLIVPGEKTTELHYSHQNIKLTHVQGIKNDSLNGLSYAQAFSENDRERLEEIQNTLVVPRGCFYPVELSDGTKVWLNSESTLQFPTKFSMNQRTVHLKGEALFVVKKDTTRPFIVEVDQAAIRVLGTTFNVNTYADDYQIYTTLVEGSICFSSNKNQEEITLTPGQQSVMNINTGKISTQEVDPQKYISWQKGRFIFEDMSLEKIMCQLERWYDITIFYQNQEIKKYKFRGVINKDMSLEKVLNIISETTDIKFNIQDRTITIYKR